MDKETQEKIAELEKRVSRLERGNGNGAALEQKPLELVITLPEAEIGGLRFNKTDVRATFDLNDEGWWRSRDILFMSARNVKEDNSRDILTEYLESADFRSSIAISGFDALSDRGYVYDWLTDLASDIEVSLPDENEGVKMYGGIIAPYWQRYTIGDEHFLSITSTGSSVRFRSDELSGVAPMFRVKKANDERN